MFRALGICVVGFVFAVGCAHKQVIDKPLREIRPAMLWKDQAKRRAFLSEFSGKLKMAYEGKDQKVSGKGRIIGRYPGAFRLELRDPLGRLHYVLTVKNELAIASYPRNRQAVRDTSGGSAYFQRVLGVSIPFNELASYFAGVIPLRWEKVPMAWEWDSEQGAYRGEMKREGEALTVWVDSGNVALQRASWERGDETLEATFSDFSECCGPEGKGFFLGYEVRVQWPSQRASVDVTWDTLDKSKALIPATAFEFQPNGEKIIELK